MWIKNKWKELLHFIKQNKLDAVQILNKLFIERARGKNFYLHEFDLFSLKDLCSASRHKVTSGQFHNKCCTVICCESRIAMTSGQHGSRLVNYNCRALTSGTQTESFFAAVLPSKLMINPEIHWQRQFATTLHKFHWQFLIFTAMAKAKKLVCKSIAQDLEQVSLTKRLFRFRNGS